MFSRIVLLALLITAGSLQAADSGTGPERFRVILTDGRMIEGHDVTVTSDGVVGTFGKDSVSTIPRADIHALQRSLGRRTRSGAQVGFLIGLGFGSLVYLSAVAEANDNSSLEVDHTKAVIFVLGSTGVGGLVGALIGHATTKWQDIPLAATLEVQPGATEARLVLNLSF